MPSTSYPSLKDRVVFVSGGGSGIGGSIVEHFAEQGSKVAFVDIDEAASRALAAKIAGATKDAVGQEKHLLALKASGGDGYTTEMGLAEVAECKIQVTDIKGPLEQGWQDKVKAFVTRIPLQV